MRSVALAVTLAIIAPLLAAAPVLGHHVKTTDCQYDPVLIVKAERSEPKGDPWFRYVIKTPRYRKHSTTCWGSVSVPDEPWAAGLTLSVVLASDARDEPAVVLTAKRAQTKRIRPGAYIGRWSNGRVSRFIIESTPVDLGPTRISLRAGGRVRTQDLDLGCVWKTGWFYDKPHTKQWVQRTEPFSQRIKTWDSGPGGYFGRLWRGYRPGVYCPRTFEVN